MVDLSTISTVLSSVKTATDIAKLLKDSNVSLEKAEVKLQLAEVISALADAKLELIAVQDLILEKDRRIKELEAAQNLKQNLEWRNGVYWLTVNGKQEGPFCPQCYDSIGKSIRLQEFSPEHWRCNTCEKDVFGKGYYSQSGQADTDYDPYE